MATVTVWVPPAASLGWIEAMQRERNGVDVGKPEPFGPCGVQLPVTGRDGDHGSVIVTQAPHGREDIEWLHASIAWAHRDPRYVELASLHRAVFGRKRWAYQVFAPAADHVSIHDHALHLFGRVDGMAQLPDFTQGTGSI